MQWKVGDSAVSKTKQNKKRVGLEGLALSEASRTEKRCIPEFPLSTDSKKQTNKHTRKRLVDTKTGLMVGGWAGKARGRVRIRGCTLAPGVCRAGRTARVCGVRRVWGLSG